MIEIETGQQRNYIRCLLQEMPPKRRRSSETESSTSAADELRQKIRDLEQRVAGFTNPTQGSSQPITSNTLTFHVQRTLLGLKQRLAHLEEEISHPQRKTEKKILKVECPEDTEEAYKAKCAELLNPLWAACGIPTKFDYLTAVDMTEKPRKIPYDLKRKHCMQMMLQTHSDRTADPSHPLFLYQKQCPDFAGSCAKYISSLKDLVPSSSSF